MTATLMGAADADAAADAAAGDVGAFASLYRRHIQVAWRLAQAVVAPGPASAGAAARATTNAFVSAVRLVGRGHDDVADQFRLHLLAAVYREANSGRDRPATAGSGGSAGSASFGPESALTTAYANLPVRWRAAVWLQEVECLPATAVGPIMGVSSAAAVQLNKRGLAGLEHRILQAGGGLPLPDLAPVLTGAVAPPPADLQAKTEAKWKSAVARDRGQAAAAGGWLTERAPRPLAAAVAGLCAVGILGLAVVGPGGTVNRLAPAAPVASGASAGGGGVAGGGSVGLGNAGNTSGTAGTAGTGATGATGGTGGSGTGAAPAAAAAAAAGPRLVATAPSSSSGSVTVTTLPPVTVTLPPVTVPPVTLPPVTLPPPVTAPPPATTPLVQVSLNTGPVGVSVGLGPTSCTGVQVLTIKLGCTGGPLGLNLGGTLLGGK